LFCNCPKQKILSAQFKNCAKSSYFVSSTKIIIVVTVKSSQKKLKPLLVFLESLGSLNNIILFETDAGTKVCFYDKFRKIGRIFLARTLTSNTLKIFPDKLKNMRGYPFKVLVMPQIPRLRLDNNGNFQGIDKAILNIIAKHQNASLKSLEFKSMNDSVRKNIFKAYLPQKKADLSLNTMYKSFNLKYRYFIDTYDQNAQCAIVPIPQPLTFLHYLLTPFDGLSWTFMIVSIVASAIVWHIFYLRLENSNSTLHFVFGVAVNFIGQGIPFRDGINHKWQTIILQCCVLMMFIMGNAYQSLIISSMSWSREGIRFNTFEELFDSGMNITTDPVFYKTMNNSGEFSHLMNRLQVKHSESEDHLRMSKNALIGRCDYLEFKMKTSQTSDLGSYYYMLPDRMLLLYEKLVMAHPSPYYEKLQTYHNYVFESGIRQYWKFLLEGENVAERKRKESYIKEEKYLLSMSDLYGLFYILLIGYTASFFCLLIEIFWHDCLKNIDYKKIMLNIARKFKRARRSMRVRQIQVHPIEV
jgi:hypothetical protein